MATKDVKGMLGDVLSVAQAEVESATKAMDTSKVAYDNACEALKQAQAQLKQVQLAMGGKDVRVAQTPKPRVATNDDGVSPSTWELVQGLFGTSKNPKHLTAAAIKEGLRESCPNKLNNYLYNYKKQGKLTYNEGTKEYALVRE